MVRVDIGGRNYRRAIAGGIIGMLAMSIFAYGVVPMIGLPALNFGVLIGSFFLPSESALAIGLVIALLAGIIWALLYEQVVYAHWPERNWLTAMLWGLVAWLIAGVTLGVMAPVHPLIANGQLTNPGFFGLGFGNWAMPVCIFATFLLYGLAMAALYAYTAHRPQLRASGHASA